MESYHIQPASTYINPYTDFGFKKLFGEEGSKDLLIDFLNQLLPPDLHIVTLEFRNTEMPPEIAVFTKAIFDLHCENERKDKFVVEMQKSRLEYFKDRVIWYTSFPIRDQAPKGKVLKIVEGEEKQVNWDFELKPIYFVGILDFEFDKRYENDEYVVEVEFKDQKNQPFYEKLKYFFVVMPRFNKKENQLVTHKDKWLYFLKNLPSFEEIPAILNEPIFQKGFALAKLANYNAVQLAEYEQSYNDYLSFIGSLDYSFKEGKVEGIAEGMERGMEKGIEKVAKEMKNEGESFEKIMKFTGLTKEQIDKL